jgi:predicted metal-dependent hydrolase
MALKTISVDDIGDVVFQKRRGTRSIKIHIRGSEVRVTMPHWVPYTQAQAFVRSRKKWILENVQPKSTVAHGSYIGKQHQLLIKPSSNKTIRTKVTDDEIIVSIPEGMELSDTQLQEKLSKAAEKALKREAEVLIAPRLHDLSIEHDLPFKQVRFKKLQSRWGSCDRYANIIINSYLVQLPWPLIDYVLIHELSHTLNPNHSAKFWAQVAACLPDYKERRRQMKNYQPGIVLD